jgi:hypothetical protein
MLAAYSGFCQIFYTTEIKIVVDSTTREVDRAVVQKILLHAKALCK